MHGKIKESDACRPGYHSRRRFSTRVPFDFSQRGRLNIQGQLMARGRQFSSDAVRAMLRNAACGYVSGRRDKSKAIKGLHQATVPEEPPSSQSPHSCLERKQGLLTAPRLAATSLTDLPSRTNSRPRKRS
jgi:hypothetical protein